MLPFERVIVGYLVFFIVVAPFSRVAMRKQAVTAIAAASMAVSIYFAARTFPLGARLWLGFLYIGIGYWIPFPLVPPARGTAFEMWLRRTDESIRLKVIRLPRRVAAWMEAGYLACFPMILLAFLVVWGTGSRDDVSHYWLAVLLSGYACYIT